MNFETRLLFKISFSHHHKSNQTVSSLTYVTKERRKLNREFAGRILKAEVEPGRITDVEAFSKVADYVAEMTVSNDDFVKDISVLLVGKEVLTFFNVTGIAQSGLVFSDTGFRFQYNDSHYCIRNDGLSNQLHHAMGGFNIGYFSGRTTATVGDFIHERLQRLRYRPSPLGVGGSSKEDSELTINMGKLGAMLRYGEINKEGIGEWITANIAVTENLTSHRKERRRLKEECDVRRNFRRFEKDQFGNPRFLPPKWHYTEDMRFEDGQWVQYYERFGDYRVVRAVWDEQSSQVILEVD